MKYNKKLNLIFFKIKCTKILLFVQKHTDKNEHILLLFMAKISEQK